MTDKLEPHPYYGHLSKEHAEHLEKEIEWLKDQLDSVRLGLLWPPDFKKHIELLEDQLHNTGDKSIQI